MENISRGENCRDCRAQEKRYKTIVYRTLMEDIPKNCNECKMEMCRLPLKANGYELLKKYLTKRHKECPLMEIEEK